MVRLLIASLLSLLPLTALAADDNHRDSVRALYDTIKLPVPYRGDSDLDQRESN